MLELGGGGGGEENLLCFSKQNQIADCHCHINQVPLQLKSMAIINIYIKQ